MPLVNVVTANSKGFGQIEALNAAFEKLELSTLTPEARVVRDIIHLVWMNVFQRCFWLREAAKQNGAG